MRLLKGRPCVSDPYRAYSDQRDQHRQAETVYSRRAAVLRDPMPKYDVQREKRAIGKGEQIAKRFSTKPRLCQEQPAASGKDERGDIAWRSRPVCRQKDRPNEFNSAHCTQ